MPGVNDNRRIPCSVSVHHGHFPSNERCPMCAPPVVKAWVPPNYTDESCQRGIAGRLACFCEECTTDEHYWADYCTYLANGGTMSGCYNVSTDTYTFGRLGHKYEGFRMRKLIATRGIGKASGGSKP